MNSMNSRNPKNPPGCEELAELIFDVMTRLKAVLAQHEDCDCIHCRNDTGLIPLLQDEGEGMLWALQRCLDPFENVLCPYQGKVNQGMVDPPAKAPAPTPVAPALTAANPFYAGRKGA